MKQKQNKNPNEILDYIYKKAIQEIKKDNGIDFLNRLNGNQKRWLGIIILKAESFKGVLTVLVTSLIKKIENSKQDVRYHKKELRRGYSGRTFDTLFITPFFKRKFRRFAMKESGWLTRSIEQPRPFTLSFVGKIRNKNVKEAFLQILNDIETRNVSPQKYLIALFALLILKEKKEKSLVSFFPLISKKKTLPIDLIIESLRLHFFQKYKTSGASRLPVLAIYSIYQILLNDASRYKNKKLLSLKSHVASDIRAKGLGDIEILDGRNRYFEGLEIKHQIQIDDLLVQDAYEKFKNLPIDRYYILTTAEPNIKPKRKTEVNALIKKIKKKHGCEVIVNGLVHSLKYYLRLLKNPAQFIEKYTENLKYEFKKTTTVKVEHLKAWQEIVAKKLFENL